MITKEITFLSELKRLTCAPVGLRPLHVNIRLMTLRNGCNYIDNTEKY